MAKKNSSVDYAAECKAIRDIYIGDLTLSQRYQIICDRLRDFYHNCPDKLVTCVTAIEAYTRSILVTTAGTDKELKLVAYKEWKRGNAMDMLKTFLEKNDISEADFYHEDSKELLEYAVEHRHMLVHEGTYLGADKYPSMIEACLEVLDKLADLTGIPKDRRYNGEPSFP